MKVLILHLSDIHFADGNNLVSTRLQKIVAAVRSVEHKFDTCLLLVSGDIAFSGKQSEYAIASDFFRQLQSELQGVQPGLTVMSVFVPGNHDCDFRTTHEDVHEAVLNSIPSKLESLKASDGLVQQLISQQEEFFSFESQMTDSDAVPPENRLFYRKQLSIDGTQIQVNCYNTSWVSRLHEQQGKILFPVQIVDAADMGTTGNQLVISMFHHPYGWLSAENSIDFERLIDHSSDVVLTGHEHVEKYSRVVGITGEEVNYSKGAVLQQEGGAAHSGFNLIYIDLDERKQRIIQYAWKDDKYSRAAESAIFDFVRNRSLKAGVFEMSNDFANELEDVGAGFDHPRKDHLRLSDIFVYPDFRDSTFEIDEHGKHKKQKPVRGSELADYVRTHGRTLIIGGDLSGKSTLSKVIVSELKDVVPVLMSGQELDGPDRPQFIRSVSRAFSREYSRDSLETFLQMEKEKRALIIDDFHKSKFRNRAALNQLIDLISQEFGIVVIFADDIFRIQELANQTRHTDPLRAFRSLSIKELGHFLRGQLIKKWVMVGQESTFDEKVVVRAVSDYAKVILNALGANILPSYPLIILTVLQAWEASQGHDMQAGSYGHIYEELITRALRKASDEPEDVDTKYTYIARLAYYAFEKQQRFLSLEQIREVYGEYVRLYRVTFPLERMLNELEAARMLKKVDGNYHFKYKYVYYYFVARYFKETIGVPEEASALRNRLLEMSDRVHNEEYANILAFYVYRTKDQEVIDRLVANANKIYDEYPPCDFDKHIGFLNKIYTSLPTLELPAAGGEDAHEEHWQKLDEVDETDPSELEKSNQLQDLDDDAYADAAYDSSLSDLLKINMALKTLQVIGQILRNSPGSMRANIKFDITRAGYQLGLRVLGALFTLVESNLEGVRQYYAKLIGEKRDVKSDTENLKLADGFLIDLTQSIAYGMLKAVSHALGHEKLIEIYSQVLKEDDNSGTRLIDLSIRLDNFKSAPETEIDELQKHFKGNTFALAVLRDLVANYLYLMPMEESTRQRLTDAFELKVTPTMLIGRDKKLLKA